jgi:two-component system NtrC family sensor kinase
LLPRSFETPTKEREATIAAAVAPPGGKVLLVEDNADVVEVARAYFTELGYGIAVAASAQAGLDLIAGEGDIDLIFSDILMPGGMNGLDLAKAVRRRFPNIVVLLTTGYSSSAQDAVRQGFQVLQKPYDLAALERALRAARKSANKSADKTVTDADAAPRRAAG